MAPVGRWQKGKDLSWYAKADDEEGKDGETAEEKRVRERKEEIRRIKEAEEDALARALGLPVPDRMLSGSNAISVGEVNRVVKEARVGEEDETDDIGKGKGFGDFVGKVMAGEGKEDIKEPEKGGLVRNGRGGDKRVEDRSRSRSRERRPRRYRDRSRSGERRRHRSRSGDRHRHRRRDEDREERRPRRHSGERRDRRYRSRSPDRYRERGDRGEHRGYSDRVRRSRSPTSRDQRGRRAWDSERRR